MRISAAAERTAGTLEANARIELRSYLGISEVGVQDVEAGKRPLIRAILRNSGRTPAKNVKTVYHAAMYPPGIGLLAPLPNDKEPSNGVLGSGDDKLLSINLTVDLTNEHVDALRSDALRIYFWGICTFEDVFGDTWSVPFQYVRQGPPGAKLEAMSVCEVGNDYRQQNS